MVKSNKEIDNTEHECPDCGYTCYCDEPDGICLCDCFESAYDREVERLQLIIGDE